MLTVRGMQNLTELSILFGRPRGMGGAEDRFEIESLAAEELGIESYSLPLDLVVLGEADRALRKLPRPSGRTWLYRGWMLRLEEYEALSEAMSERDESFVVDPESFAETSYAPNYLPLLGAHTSPAAWTESESITEAWEVAQTLGPPPYVIKDWVKSAKEEWHRACFVPEGATYDEFAAVCERLLEIRGELFETGFVIKKYQELATLPGWTPEQRRVTDEHRLVFWEGRLVCHAPYYDVDCVLDDPRRFEFLGRVIGSPFFIADVARLAAGGYTVLEINEGGSAILPEQLDPRDFYRTIL